MSDEKLLEKLERQKNDFESSNSEDALQLRRIRDKTSESYLNISKRLLTTEKKINNLYKKIRPLRESEKLQKENYWSNIEIENAKKQIDSKRFTEKDEAKLKELENKLREIKSELTGSHSWAEFDNTDEKKEKTTQRNKIRYKTLENILNEIRPIRLHKLTVLNNQIDDNYSYVTDSQKDLNNSKKLKLTEPEKISLRNSRDKAKSNDKELKQEKESLEKKIDEDSNYDSITDYKKQKEGSVRRRR